MRGLSEGRTGGEGVVGIFISGTIRAAESSVHG